MTLTQMILLGHYQVIIDFSSIFFLKTIKIEQEELEKEKLRAETEKENQKKKDEIEQINIDPIIRDYKKALVKLEDIEVNDSVGMF